MKILGIETSCDETSASVVADGKQILSNVIASQIAIHSKFGGVVPEVASRRHVELILPTVEEALTEANCKITDIDAVAVINRPGLIGALIVGVAAAKTIAYGSGLPLIPVHHLEAHIYANYLTQSEIELPAICLVVSGGHSDIILMRQHGAYEILARTKDDAAGEAFDKSARALGLGYPGGPVIDKLAKLGNAAAVAFPRAKLDNPLDFSFSGLKTAVIRYAQNPANDTPIEDVAASFQQAVIDVLVDHTFDAAREHGVRQVMVAGGVAANSGLQAQMKARAASEGIAISIPPPVLCTDNAAMVACAAFYNLQNGISAGLDLDCMASQKISEAGTTH